MLTNFFKVAFRNLWRSRGFSAINIVGLAIGMASAIIILLWIQNEVSYDQFHEKKDRIYEVWNQVKNGGVVNSWNNTPKVLARAMERDLPEVANAARVNYTTNFLFTVGDKSLMVPGNIVDSSFLQVFSFPLLEGNLKTALNDMHSVVLTQKLAIKLFGKNENIIGKIIKIADKENFTVTGILKDLPNNTRFKFEYLLPWSCWNHVPALGTDDTNWGNNSTQTYVLLKPSSSLASVEPKVRVLKQKYDIEAKQMGWQMFLYPVGRWRLYSNFENGYETNSGQITYVRLFGIIAAFILLIACINFMNLSTARSEKRAKEVGIRKVVGARKISLINQFIGESILISFLAAIIAIVIVQFSLPAFNQLTQKQLVIPSGSISFWLAAIGFIIFTGVLAGSYPAFFLSSFQPVKVLKGTFQKAHALITPRKILVVLQFTFAIALITCTIIVKQQIDYAKDRQAGYDKNNLIEHFFIGDIEKNYTLIKNELLSSGIATAVTKTSAPLTENWSNGWGDEWEGKDPNDKTSFDYYNEDGGLGATAGLHFIIGRDIDLQKFPTDSLAMIINESSLKVMKFKNPIGQSVKSNGMQWHVVGVIKDFILESPYAQTKPMMIFGPKAWFTTMQVKLNSKKNMAQNLKNAEAVFKKYNPQYPFDYKFVDQEYAQKFEDANRTGILAGLFAGLTISISCLGLFGLATYMAETRIKEIGVRKVLGASVIDITTLLSEDFVKLVIISIILASPIAWFAMHKWLENYPYRITISWLVFIASGSLAICIAILTVSFQAIKAAIANPVKSLRSE
jgi:putative ABC transport system permease protein